MDRPVMFAGFDWPSARFHNAVAKFMVATLFGCETDDLPGSTIPLLAGLRRGDVDVAMEVWIDRATKIWEDGVKRGQLASVGVNMPNASQSWYVPRYMIEGDAKRGIEPVAPDLESVFDLPRYAALFKDPERPRLGRFYNCSLGWLCEILNSKKLAAYDLERSFSNFRVGTGAALAAAIASHYAKGEPFVAYYWDPSWITARYDLVALDEPPYSDEAWDAFVADRRPDTALAFPVVEQHIGVNTGFRDEAGPLVSFLSAYGTSRDLMREVLLFMYENEDVEGEALARWFLKTHPDVWRSWLTGNQIALVEARMGSSAGP
ncbi:MAG: ABC transporter substrate-binding protein [Alphaproteobacteria bacterium]